MSRPEVLIALRRARDLTDRDFGTAYEELKAKGVTFLQEPAERPYGIEAVFRDDSGNWFRLNQHKRFGG